MDCIIMPSDYIYAKKTFIEKIFGMKERYFRYELLPEKNLKLIRMPFTNEEGMQFCKANEKNFSKLLDRICEYLHKNKIENIIVKEMEFLKSYLSEKYFIKEPQTQALFLSGIDFLVKKYAKKNRLDLNTIEVGIIFDDYTTNIDYVIKKLTKITKYISLFTSDTIYATSKLEEIYEEYGLAVKISTKDSDYIKNMDIVILCSSLAEEYCKKIKGIIFNAVDNNSVNKKQKIDDIYYIIPDSFNEFINMSKLKPNLETIAFMLSTLGYDTNDINEIEKAIDEYGIKIGNYIFDKQM